MDGKHQSCMFSRFVVKVTNQLLNLFCSGLDELITKEVYMQRRAWRDDSDIIWVVWHNYPGSGVAFSVAFSAVGRCHIKRDMQNVMKEPDCKQARLLCEFVTFEFLSGVARCAGYKPLHN